MKLGARSLTSLNSAPILTNTIINQWFGGRLLKPQDRLQSRGKYFPYGEDRYSPNPANPANDQEKFATYTRDSATGLDYANQRYYGAGLGRFASPDPYGGSASPTDPQSMNRYSFVKSDPVNLTDPTGMLACGDYDVYGTGQTVSQEVLADTNQGHYIDLVWHEAGNLGQANGSVSAWSDEFQLVALAIWNRYQLARGNLTGVGANGIVYTGLTNTGHEVIQRRLRYFKADTYGVRRLGYLSRQFAGTSSSTVTLNMILLSATSGVTPAIVDPVTGALVDHRADLINSLGEDRGDTSVAGPGKLALVTNTGAPFYVTQHCYGVIAAMESANSASVGQLDYLNAYGVVTSWRTNFGDPNYIAGIEFYLYTEGPTNFFGLAPAP